MWNSGSTSLDLAKGNKFLEKLQYVQHVDQEKITASEISEQIFQYLLANRKVCHDSNLTENVGNPKANLDILKSSLRDRQHITDCHLSTVLIDTNSINKGPGEYQGPAHVRITDLNLTQISLRYNRMTHVCQQVIHIHTPDSAQGRRHYQSKSFTSTHPRR